MDIPGFSAEVSLFKANLHYRLAAGWAKGECGQEAIPQDLIPPGWNEFCTGCYELVWGVGQQTCCRKTPFGSVCWRRFCEIPR
jgi:hypothetical protein